MLMRQTPAARFGRGVLAIAFLLAWSGALTLPRSAARADDAGSQRAAAVRQIQACYQAIAAARRDIPHDSFDLSAAATAAGADPQVAAAWVRDQTCWVPYSGALRGPLGVLMDRVGNSLDRASLLAELLRRDGKVVRLAHAVLALSSVAPMATRATSTHRHPSDAAVLATDESVEDLVKRYAVPAGLDPQMIRRTAQDMLAHSNRMAEQIAQRSTVQSSTLAQMIWPAAGDAAAGQPATANAAAGSDAVGQALRDHWWVQWQDGSTWNDADADPPAGPLPAPAETLAWEPKRGLSPLPAERCQCIQLRVIIEQSDSGRLLQRAVLEQSLRPADLIGKYITFVNAPLRWPDDLDLSSEKDAAAKLKSAALDQHEWLPVLRIGDQQIYKVSFTDVGTVNEKPDLMGTRAAASAASAGAAAFGGEAPAAPSTGVLTAQWLEYVIQVPGEPEQRIRRQIFDLIGPAARASAGGAAAKLSDDARLSRSLSLLQQTEIAVLPCRITAPAVAELSAASLMNILKPLAALAASDHTDPGADKVIDSAITRMQPPPGWAYDVAVARDQFNPQRDQLYLGRPNIFSIHQGLLLDAQGQPVSTRSFDIVANDTAIRPGSAVDERMARLSQGVLDTNAEAVIAGGDERSFSAADALDNQPDPSQWLVIRQPDDARWKQANVPADLRQHADAELALGYTIAVPTGDPGSPASSCWWRVDPRTGQTLGMGANGWGQVTVEEGILFFEVSVIACSGFSIARGIRTKARGAACVLGSLGLAMCFSTTLIIRAIGVAAGGAAIGLG